MISVFLFSRFTYSLRAPNSRRGTSLPGIQKENSKEEGVGLNETPKANSNDVLLEVGKEPLKGV